VLSVAEAPLPGVHVTLARDDTVLSETDTAADGIFRFRGLAMGTYRLSVPGITVAGIALDGWQTKNVKLTSGTPVGYHYVVAQKRPLPKPKPPVGISSTVGDGCKRHAAERR